MRGGRRDGMGQVGMGAWPGAERQSAAPADVVWRQFHWHLAVRSPLPPCPAVLTHLQRLPSTNTRHRAPKPFSYASAPPTPERL